MLNPIDFNSIEEAKAQGLKMADDAGHYEAEFKDLKRNDPIILAKLTREHSTKWKTNAEAKNAALTDPRYKEHIQKMYDAEDKALRFQKGYMMIRDYLNTITAKTYERNTEMKLERR